MSGLRFTLFCTARLERLFPYNHRPMSTTLKRVEKPLPMERQYDIDLNDIGPALGATLSLASLANSSETIRRLVDLGVDVSRCEKRAASLLAGLRWEHEAEPVVRLLNSLAVDPGPVLTKNPHLLKENVDCLETRLEYLEKKGFPRKDVLSCMVSRAPFLLMHSVERLDRRLALLQQLTGLRPFQLRNVVLGAPRIMTTSLHPVRKTLFTIHEEMSFSNAECHTLILACPKLLLTSAPVLRKRFTVLHEELGVCHEVLLDFPNVFRTRDEVRLRPRGLYLKHLGRDQWDPQLPGYVSLRALVSGSDGDFCEQVAHTCIDDFHLFLKGL
ncbi:transcription termination factor 3, mitochondrial-like [Ornithodoros turicata]